MKKLKMGMVGGGQGAFIGAVHRIAAQLDNKVELVCGAFNASPTESILSGMQLGLHESRCYPSYEEMLDKEAKLPLSERMDFVVIVTPNHLHYPVATSALKAGFHVLSDKPATLTLDQVNSLNNIVDETGKVYGLTHTYTGYPMVKQAKHLIEQGKLGQIRKIVVEYSQGWLADQHNDTLKQASWRLDPVTSGSSCCMADIGVHAANLAEYVSGLEISDICADLNTIVDGRLLDDDGTVLLKFDNGAKGLLTASQIALGEENNLRIRIYGDKASIDWNQQEPNSLWLKFADKPTQLIRAGVGELCASAKKAIRLPAGHPEGYIEAFANVYHNFCELIRAHKRSNSIDYIQFDVPGINEAIRGMAFIENAVAASKSSSKWHPFLTSSQALAQEHALATN